MDSLEKVALNRQLSDCKFFLKYETVKLPRFSVVCKIRT